MALAAGPPSFSDTMNVAPRFLVSGYYGFGNTGDEAILAGLIEGFRELCPAAELTVLSGDPASTRAEHVAGAAYSAEVAVAPSATKAGSSGPTVIAVPRGLRSARHQLRRCDAFISGGGGLLQDATSWLSPLYYLALIRLALSAHRPVAFIGQSIGPLTRRWLRSLARRALSRVDLLAVRDELSRRSLAELGLSRTAEVTGDLAFLLPRPTEDEIAAARKRAGIPDAVEHVAAIALRRPPASADDRRLTEIAAAVGRSCDELGLRPLLLPMQGSQDASLARALAGAFPSRNAIIAPPLRAREALALIAGCRLVVAMRLHALIFAALCGAPPVAISYDPKVDGLVEQLGLRPAADTRRQHQERLNQVIHDTWEARAELSQALAARLPDLHARALRNVELALSLLPGR